MEPSHVWKGKEWGGVCGAAAVASPCPGAEVCTVGGSSRAWGPGLWAAFADLQVLPHSAHFIHKVPAVAGNGVGIRAAAGDVWGSGF